MVINESKISDLKHEMDVKGNALKAVELKVKKLKEQLLSSVKVVKLQRYNLEELRKTVRIFCLHFENGL